MLMVMMGIDDDSIQVRDGAVGQSMINEDILVVKSSKCGGVSIWRYYE